MIHPQYGTEMVVNPTKVKRLQELGWKLKTEPTTEVLKFDQNKTAQFIEAKKQALPFPVSIEPEKPAPDPIDEPQVNKGGRPAKTGKK
jgi:hypothetical protein